MAKKKNWIQGAIKRPGAFNKKAKAAGMSTEKFAKKVTSEKSSGKYSERTKRQANLAQTLAKFNYGGQAYALPTSAAATTNNMMGMGDPAQLQKNLQMANAIATEQNQRIKAQEDMRTKAASQESKDNFESAYTRSQEQIASLSPGFGQAAVNATRLAQGTLNAAQVADLSGNSTASLLNNLNMYGPLNKAQTAGQALKAGVKSMGPGAAAAGLGLAGAGVKHLSNDKDATTMNVGETAGTLMQGAGTGLGLAGTLGLMGAVPGVGWAAAGLGALGYGIHGLVQRNKARVEQERVDKQNAIARQNMSIAQQQAFEKNFIKQGSDIGYNVGNSMTNSYTPNQQMMYAKNGGMIKRADGSYSSRGLWDNIRANEGSGKKPTKQMLEQEKKIKAQEKKEGGVADGPFERALRKQNRQTRRAQKQYERASKKANRKGISPYKDGGIKVPGGKIQSLGGDAVKFVGQTHAQGGIMIDPQTEVEHNETMDKVQMKGGGMSDYIFSEHLKLGGVSFAKRHERLLKNGANQKDIQQLAKLQEAIAAKEGKDENGPRGPERIMKNGGIAKYQLGDFLSEQSNSPGYTDIGLSPDNIYYPQLGYNWLQQGNAPNIDFTSIEVGKPGSAAAMQGSPFQTGYGLPADMTDAELEDFYTNAHIPGITRSFNENRDQVIANAKAAAEFADVNKQNFDLKIRNADGSFISDDEIFNQALALTTDRKIGSWHVPAWQKTKTIERIPDGDIPGGDIPDGDIPEGEIPGKERVPNRAWMAALPGLVGLGIDGNYPAARTMSPQMQRGVNLPRINLNAERAANSAMNIGTKRQLSNQLSGPAGVAASLAANQQARQQNLAIGNEEARGNKELMAQEASLNTNIAGQNQAAFNQAGMFNSKQLQERDVNQFEQQLLLKKYKTDVLKQTAKDAMQYQSDERLARATDDTGSYMRFLQENPQFMQTMINQMNNTATETKETTAAKNGGYIKRGNKLKRKKK